MPTASGLPPDGLDKLVQALEDLVTAAIRRIAGALARVIHGSPNAGAVNPVDDAAMILPLWATATTVTLVPAVQSVWVASAVALSEEFAAAGVANSPLGPDQAAAYLEGAANRLVGIGNLVWGEVRTQLAEGVALGEGIPELAARVREAAGVSEERATVIARTECLSGDVSVNAANITALFRRWYEGEWIEVVTASGRKFAGTPNHPMLTRRGWVGLGDLKEGDDLVRYGADVQRTGSAGDEHVEDRPPTLSEIWDAVSAVDIPEWERSAEPDFHGDGMDGYVDVLRPDRMLVYGVQSPLDQRLLDSLLTPSHATQAREFGYGSQFATSIPIDSASRRFSVSDWDAFQTETSFYPMPADSVGNAEAINGPSRLVFSEDLSRWVVVSQAVPEPCGMQEFAGGGRGPNLDSRLGRDPGHGRSFASDDSRDDGGPESGFVEFDNLVSVGLREWKGHVYNLTTRQGLFVADQFYTSNTISASNAASFAQAQTLQDATMTKVWMATPDARTRHTHVVADGQTQPLMSPFEVGGFPLMFPGDPAGPPGEVISCRCTQGYDFEAEQVPAEETTVAAVDHNPEFNRLHPRGDHGRFGRKHGPDLTDALKELTGEDQGGVDFDDGRYVDFSTVNDDGTRAFEWGHGNDVVQMDLDAREARDMLRGMSVTLIAGEGEPISDTSGALRALAAKSSTGIEFDDESYVDWSTRLDDGGYRLEAGGADGVTVQMELTAAEFARIVLALGGTLSDDGTLIASALVAAAEVHTGAMVALAPCVEDAYRLEVGAGEPAEQLHATLVYLGDDADLTPEQRHAILALCVELAAARGPLELDAFGVSIFNPTSDERDTAIVLPLGGDEGPDLAALHDAVLAGVTGILGDAMPQQHEPYASHLTLAYTDDLSMAEEWTDRNGPILFDHIRVAFGGDVFDIPLSTCGCGHDDYSLTAAGKFNPNDHPRNPKGGPGGGRFRSLADRVADAVKGGDSDLKGLDREQARKAAKAHGIELKRGESEDSIKAKLVAKLGGKGGAKEPDQPTAKKTAPKPTGKPKEISPAEFEATIPADRRFYRGVKSVDGARYTRDGGLGQGDFGHGIYLGSLGTAMGYAQKFQGDRNGRVLRGGILPGAVVKKLPAKVAGGGGESIDRWAAENDVDVIDIGGDLRLIRNPAALVFDEHDYTVPEAVILDYRDKGYSTDNLDAEYQEAARAVSELLAPQEPVKNVDQPKAPVKRAPAKKAEVPEVTPPTPESDTPFDRLLGDGPGTIQNKQTRQLVEQMEMHDWKLDDYNPLMDVTNWSAPDGRTLQIQFIRGKKSIFRINGGDRTGKAALAHVVTPELEDVSKPNIFTASRNLGLPEPDVTRSDPTQTPLADAQRDLTNGDFSPQAVETAATRLRNAAERNRDNAATAGRDDTRTPGWTQRADQFDKIADELERMGKAREGYLAELERTKGAPLDIRPNPRSASAPKAPMKAAAKAAATVPGEPMVRKTTATGKLQPHVSGETLRQLEADTRAAKKELTPSQLKAVEQWTSGRGMVRKIQTGQVSEDTAQNFDDAMRTLPKVDGLVYRAVSSEGESSQFAADLNPGQVLDLGAPVSTSIDPRKSGAFGTNLYEIESPAASYVAGVGSKFGYEKEAVLAPGRYEVVSSEMVSLGLGSNTVKVRVVRLRDVTEGDRSWKPMSGKDFQLAPDADEAAHKVPPKAEDTGRAAEVARINDTPIVGKPRRLGGTMGITSLEEHEGGLLVRKDEQRFGSFKEHPDNYGGRDPAESADAEELVALVGQAVGVRTPAILRTGPTEVLMEHIDGKSGADIVPWGRPPPDELVNSDSGRLMGLLDAIVLNGDRNEGNWILTDNGDIAGIDHADSFDSPEAARFTGSEFAAHFIDVNANPTGPLGFRVDFGTNDMSPDDMITMRARLVALRPEFERTGHGDWFDQMMKRFDTIAAQATGTRSRLGTPAPPKKATNKAAPKADGDWVTGRDSALSRGNWTASTGDPFPDLDTATLDRLAEYRTELEAA